MDVTNVEEAIIAEEAGAVAVMASERVASDIRKDGGVARKDNILVTSFHPELTGDKKIYEYFLNFKTP